MAEPPAERVNAKTSRRLTPLRVFSCSSLIAIIPVHLSLSIWLLLLQHKIRDHLLHLLKKRSNLLLYLIHFSLLIHRNRNTFKKKRTGTLYHALTVVSLVCRRDTVGLVELYTEDMTSSSLSLTPGIANTPLTCRGPEAEPGFDLRVKRAEIITGPLS